MAPWCILCIILCSTSCHYDVYSAVRHATMMYTLHYTLHSVLVPWCILCIILCIPSCHHHECSVCILLPWWMQSKHVHSALISYSEPASLQDKCRVCKLCLILCLNLWSPPPLHIQYSARILECISIRQLKIWIFSNFSTFHFMVLVLFSWLNSEISKLELPNIFAHKL